MAPPNEVPAVVAHGFFARDMNKLIFLSPSDGNGTVGVCSFDMHVVCETAVACALFTMPTGKGDNPGDHSW